MYLCGAVTLAQLVKVSVGQADIQKFEPHIRHNWFSCCVFLVKSRHFGLPLDQTKRPNWQSFAVGGSVTTQTWSIYKVYTLQDEDNYCSKSERVITRLYLYLDFFYPIMGSYMKYLQKMLLFNRNEHCCILGLL